MRGFLVFSAVIFWTVFALTNTTASTEPLRRIKPRRFQIDLPAVLLSDPYDGSRPKRQYFSQYPTYQQPPYIYQNVAQQPQYFVAQPAPYRPQPPRIIPQPQPYQRSNIVSQQYVRPPVVPRIQPPPVVVTPPHARIPPAYLSQQTPPPTRHLVTNAPPRHIGYVTNTNAPKYIEPTVVTEEPWVAEISSTIAPLVTNAPYIAPTTQEYIAPRVIVTNAPPRVTNPPRIETTTTEYIEEVTTTTPYIAPTTTTVSASENVSNQASEVLIVRTNTGYSTNPPEPYSNPEPESRALNLLTVSAEPQGPADPYNPAPEAPRSYSAITSSTTVQTVISTPGYTFSTAQTTSAQPVDPYVPSAESVVAPEVPRSYPAPALPAITSTVGPVIPADPYVPSAEPVIAAVLPISYQALAPSTTLLPVTQGYTQPPTTGYTQPPIPANPYIQPAEPVVAPELPRSYPVPAPPAPTSQPVTQEYTQPPIPVDPYIPPAEPVVAPEVPISYSAPAPPASTTSQPSTSGYTHPPDPYISPAVASPAPSPIPPTPIPTEPPLIDTYNEQPAVELPQNHPAPPAPQSYANQPTTLTPPPGPSHQESQTTTPSPTTPRTFPSAAPPLEVSTTTTQPIITTTQQTWIPEDPSPADPYFPPEAVHTPKFDESFVGQYYYGKRGEGNTTFPLPSCFYNPSGYVCCSLMLNELMTASFEETRKGKHSSCNVQKIANALQKHSEKIFDTQFETVVSYEDFSQKIHFKRDLVCKIEVEGRFILAYATPESVEAQKIIPTVPSQNIVKDDSIDLKEQLRRRIQESEEVRNIIAN